MLAQIDSITEKVIKEILKAREDRIIELERQVAVLQAFIATRWFVDIQYVKDNMDKLLTDKEFDMVKMLQHRLKSKDWILEELDRLEANLTSTVGQFEKVENLFNYGRPLNEEERKAEEVVK